MQNTPHRYYPTTYTYWKFIYTPKSATNQRTHTPPTFPYGGKNAKNKNKKNTYIFYTCIPRRSILIGSSRDSSSRDKYPLQICAAICRDAKKIPKKSFLIFTAAVLLFPNTYKFRIYDVRVYVFFRIYFVYGFFVCPTL